MTSPSFAFTKWYIDCLDADGRLVILYWTSVQFGAVRLKWHSVIQCRQGTRTRSRSSLLPCPAPARTDSGLRWKSSRLDASVNLHAGVTPTITHELAPGVTWRTVVPAGSANVRVGDTDYTGTGYAEVIDLTVWPWTLDIAELRWGRWIADGAGRSLVWISWRDQMSWAFLDGKGVSVSTMTERKISAGSATLTMEKPSVVMDRGLKHTIAKIPALASVVPKWLTGGHEERRTRAGVLTDQGAEIRGTVVDEVVTFG